MSFGGVFLKAWMLGIPVIGGEAAAVRDAISEGVDGYIVPQKPEILAERTIALLDQPDVRKEMDGRDRQKTLSHYTWESLADQTEAIYHSLLGGRAPTV